MAINVNTVYQTVLLILNKEQRGYLTPAEFNKIASQVQLEIFEKYFEDLNQQLRGPGFQDEYADRVDNIEEKDISFSYIRKPKPVVWAYREGPQGQYIWDGAPTGSGPTIPSTGSVDFEISEQDQVEAVLRVLMYAGVVIRDPQIVQAASAEAAKNEQNQKT